MLDSKKLGVLIIDGDPLWRERINKMLKDDPDIEIIGQCGDPYKALQIVQEMPPDLIILDMQMPEIDSPSILEMFDVESGPLIIYMTAHKQYAVRAFELDALDFLLKPFDRDRFERAIQRAKAEIDRKRSDRLNDRIIATLEELKWRPSYLERLIVKNEGHMYFLRTDEIDWMEAEGNYVCVHVGKKTHLLRQPISTLENKMDPKKFLRIHRSIIVNVDRMQELYPWFHGDYRVILNDGTQLTLSRYYREKLRDVLGKHF
jgi:two-component system, LytTR family, response regulator